MCLSRIENGKRALHYDGLLVRAGCTHCGRNLMKRDRCLFPRYLCSIILTFVHLFFSFSVKCDNGIVFHNRVC